MQTSIKFTDRVLLPSLLCACLLPKLALAQESTAAPAAPSAPDSLAEVPATVPPVEAQESARNQAVATVVVNTAEPRPSSIELAPAPAEQPRPKLLHGFRLGYMHWMNYDKRIAPETNDGFPEDGPSSPKDALDLQSPHMFLLGYEVAQRLSAGSEALNVLLVGNAMLAGLEQSRFLPTANALIGFEMHQALQLAVGANLAPVGLDDKFAHMIVAAGWTPRSGDLYLPVHVFFIPDVDGYHRMGLTFGVTWERGAF